MVPSRRRPPAFTSRPHSWSGSRSAACHATWSRCMWGPGLSAGQRPRTRGTIACMRNGRGEVTAATADALNTVRARGSRIIAVGTTRRCGCWKSAALPDGRLQPFADETAIFITPGYRFRCVDMLVTNFHLPKSTLFMRWPRFAGLTPCARPTAMPSPGLPLLLLWRWQPAASPDRRRRRIAGDLISRRFGGLAFPCAAMVKAALHGR